MRIKSALFISILLIISVCISSASEQRTVKVGAFNYYPGIFRDKDGAVKGFYVDALADIAKRENIRFEYVYGSWSEGLDRIRSGEVDLLTSVAYTPERAAYMDYTKTPLLTVWSELYVPLVSDIDGIRHVQGKKIAVMKGDFNARSFIELVNKIDIACEFIEYPGFEQVFKAVESKQVDAGVVNSTFGVAKQKEYGLRSTGIVFNPFDIFFTVAKGKNADLLKLLDDYLASWRHQPDSPYIKARQKWSHGTGSIVSVIPKWVINAALALNVLIILAAIFIVLLKRQVQRATSEILQSKAILSESEAKFRSYIDNSPDGVFVTDENGNYLEINPAASVITGYSEEELLRMSIADLIPPSSIEPAQNNFKTLKETGAAYGEFELQHKSGGHRWWSVDAIKLSETRYLGFTKDISDRRLIEETHTFLLSCGSSSTGNNFFESLAQYLSRVLEMDYVCIDRLYGDGLMARTVAVYCDGTFEDNVEYALKDTPCGDVVGKAICLFQHDVRHMFPQDLVLQEMKAESYIGTTLWSFDGQPIGLIAVIGRQPITNPALAEAVLKIVAIRSAGELERTLAEEELKQKNRELERFTYTVSHDLKSPLITIQSFAGQIRHDLESGRLDRMPGDLKRIENASANMTMLLDDLLELSRVGRVINSAKLIDMNGLVKDVLAQLAGPITQRNVELVPSCDLSPVYGDHRRIWVVVQNLVENAIKYMGDQSAPRIEIGMRKDAKQYVFYVRDNGKGVEPRYHETIFGLFNKLDARSKGTGVGLSLVKRIIEVHGGRVWVESDGSGKGSTFCFFVGSADEIGGG